MPIEPQAVSLASGEQQRFTPAGSQFRISPEVGAMEGDVYKAPRFVPLGRTVTVTAPGVEGAGVITLIAEPFWMFTVLLYWIITIPLVVTGIHYFWPQTTGEDALHVSPPAVTLRSGQAMRFYATYNGATTNDVTWTASTGAITPAGDFIAPTLAPAAAPIQVEVAAKGPGGRSITAKAMVLVTPANSLILSPSVAFLAGGATQVFSADEVSTASFSGLGGAEGQLAAGSAKTQTYIAPKDFSGMRAVTVTASTADGRIASARVFVRGANVTNVQDQTACLMWLAALMGAAGALVGTIRSFVNYVGSRTFRASWSMYYLMHPVFGAGLALIVFAGFPTLFGGSDGGCGPGTCANVMKVVFYSGLVGLFSDIALQKLRDIVCTIFGVQDKRPDKMGTSPGTTPKKGDAEIKSPAPPTAPEGGGSTGPAAVRPSVFSGSVQSSVPSVAAGRLEVLGSGFKADMDATIDGTPRPVNVISDQRLEITLDKSHDSAGKTVTLVLIERSTGARSAPLLIRL